MGSLKDNEQALKSVLNDLQFNVDTDQVWQNISPQLVSREKSDKPFWFFFFTGVGLITIIGVAFFLGTYNPSVNQQVSEQSKDSDNIIQSEQITNSKEGKQTNTTILTNDSNNTEINTESITSTNKDLATEKISESHSENNKEAISKNQPNQNNLNNINNSSRTYLDTKTTYEQNSNLAISVNSVVTSEDVELTNSNDVHNNATESNASRNEFVGLGPTLAQQTNIFQKETTNDIETEVKKDNVTVLSAITISNIASIDSKAIVERNEISMHLIPSFIELAQDEQASWQQVISLSSGLNKSLLSNTLMQGQTEMTEDVFNNETGLYGSSSDFSFGMENTNGWRFFAGVSYVTQHSSFEKHEKETSESLVPGTGSQINSAGVVQDVPVTLVEVKTTQYDLRWHRKHKYVDLNLGVGKTIARHGHLVFGLTSAINYNLSANHQGYYFANDAESAFTKFSADEENPYRDNMGLSLKMAMHVEWRHKMIGIGFSPFVQYRNNSILNSETFYKTSDNNIGVQLSLNIRSF